MFATDKPVAAVRLEGTLCDADRNPLPEQIALLEALRDTHYVVIVSPLAHTEGGLRVVWDFVITNSVPYDEVWAAPGIPPADQWYDNEALTL